jgi:hypothetical protein
VKYSYAPNRKVVLGETECKQMVVANNFKVGVVAPPRMRDRLKIGEEIKNGTKKVTTTIITTNRSSKQ